MIPKKVEAIMRSLLDNGYEAYIIGGAVRDYIMGIKPNDWDVFTNATGDEILSIFPHGTVIGGDKRRAKILTVIVDGVEVSQYRSNGDRTKTGTSLEQHLSTCDFTINSMAMDIDRKLINTRYGAAHIQSKCLYCEGDPKDRIEEDKLRALRAIRFAVKYNLSIEKKLSRIIYYLDITDVPVERIREEMLKIFKYNDGLEMLYNANLISKIVPEFELSSSLGGGKHHSETVDQHMFNAQDIACELTDNPILIFACAFHDIGKPTTQEPKDDGDISFHNHEKVGAEMIHNIMNRMKFSKNDTKFVETLISEHMFGHYHNISDKAFVKHFKLLEDAGVSINDFVIMQYSDNQANTKNKRIKFGDYLNQNKIIKKYYEMKFSSTPFQISDIAISGNDVINAGIPIGAEIGNVLREIFEKVVDGDIENERHALMRYLKTREIR